MKCLKTSSVTILRQVRFCSLAPRSSATLSRRILQAVLQEQGYSERKLHLQIKAARNESDPNKKLPVWLSRIVDAVREFGNFSAHQEKDIAAHQVIEVEPGEAEICLDIVEGLFEHYYVRPAMESEKLKTVNRKLQQSGRAPL